MRTREDLKSMQSAPLSVKVIMSQARIREWVREYGEDGVYVSLSGGKDSTVLSDLVDKLYPGNHIPRVHVNTGLEYPEIEEFVKSDNFHDVVILRPKKNFKQVITEYGYPFITKEVSEAVYYAKKYVRKVKAKECARQGQSEPGGDKQTTQYHIGISSSNLMELVTIEELNLMAQKNEEESQRTNKPWLNERFQRLMGKAPKLRNGQRSRYDCSHWQPLLFGPYEFSSECCKIMKKAPAHEYAHKTGRHPMTGQMADESRLRTQQWIRNGCNGFQMKEPISNPMSFWTEQDVLHYIKENNLPICSVYGDIIAENDEIEGQMSLADYGLMDGSEVKLKTTGCSRTGCIFCGYGCHLEKPGDERFVQLKETHPKIYEWIFKPTSEGGLGYKEVIDWLNENAKTHINY